MKINFDLSCIHDDGLSKIYFLKYCVVYKGNTIVFISKNVFV